MARAGRGLIEPLGHWFGAKIPRKISEVLKRKLGGNKLYSRDGAFRIPKGFASNQFWENEDGDIFSCPHTTSHKLAIGSFSSCTVECAVSPSGTISLEGVGSSLFLHR